MRRRMRLATAPVLALALLGQACEERSLSGAPAVAVAASDAHTNTNQARKHMTLRVRLGEGFQNNTVSVRVDGKEVFRKSGVSTDWTISRADSLEVPLDAPSVQLEVTVDDGPRVARAIEPAQTPFVEVRFINGELQLHAMGEEPPML
jgi:hypothetical protein